MIESLHVVGKDATGKIVWEVRLPSPIGPKAMRGMAAGYARPTPLCREGEPNMLVDMIAGIVVPDVQRDMKEVMLTAIRKILEEKS